MLPHALALFRRLPLPFIQGRTTNTEVRNLVANLLHRLALVFLRPQLAEWRYQRGYRSLLDNLQQKRGKLGNAEKQIEDDERGHKEVVGKEDAGNVVDQQGEEDDEDGAEIPYEHVNFLL